MPDDADAIRSQRKDKVPKYRDSVTKHNIIIFRENNRQLKKIEMKFADK
jgi:hypothetical protein